MAIYRLELDDNYAPQLIEEENGQFDHSNVPGWWLQDHDIRQFDTVDLSRAISLLSVCGGPTVSNGRIEK